MSVLGIVRGLISFYELLIIVYVLMSWLNPTGGLYEAYRTLGTVVEPYLGIFRRFIPPIGMVDISPIIAILVLQLVLRFI